MANPLFNRVDITLDAQTIQAIQQQLDSIKQSMPFLLELTPDEIMRMPKIDVSNHDFVRETLNSLDTEQIPLPQGISAEGLKRDFELYNQLDSIALHFEQMYKMIQHTRTLAGSEAYQSSLLIYKLVQTYAGIGLPGYGALYERLKSRFTGQGSTTKNETPPQNEAGSTEKTE